MEMKVYFAVLVIVTPLLAYPYNSIILKSQPDEYSTDDESEIDYEPEDYVYGYGNDIPDGMEKRLNDAFKFKDAGEKRFKNAFKFKDAKEKRFKNAFKFKDAGEKRFKNAFKFKAAEEKRFKNAFKFKAAEEKRFKFV